MSWDWEKDRDEAAADLRRQFEPPIGPLELADQMQLDAAVAGIIEYFSRRIYGRGTGELIGFLGAIDVESDQRRTTGT